MGGSGRGCCYLTDDGNGRDEEGAELVQRSGRISSQGSFCCFSRERFAGLVIFEWQCDISTRWQIHREK